MTIQRSASIRLARPAGEIPAVSQIHAVQAMGHESHEADQVSKALVRRQIVAVRQLPAPLGGYPPGGLRLAGFLANAEGNPVLDTEGRSRWGCAIPVAMTMTRHLR